ncbi:unnamed protein product [Effrenium voratum]|uniref:Uncharacterized protein n=1 Tax=Effrenium voratum TaxID=2562239 RepID=A0AA36NMR5_9DINO|nr:unnamed protein product [Effrenium voratum]
MSRWKISGVLCVASGGLSWASWRWSSGERHVAQGATSGTSATSVPSVTPDRCEPCPGTAPLEVTFYPHERLNPKVSVRPGGFFSTPWRVQAGSRVQLVLQLPGRYNKACQNAKVLRNYMAWFGAEDAQFLFAAKGLPANASEGGKGRLTLDFVVHDAGVYNVWIWAFGLKLTQAARLPKLVATSSELNSGVEVPPRQCRLGQDTFKDGRWVKVSALRHGACSSCTPDGYLSPTCHWALPPSPERVLRHAASASLRPWVVFMGSSVSRGSAHAIMEFLGQSSLREFWYLHRSREPGHGTAVKCWGWFDTQIGNLRVSYSDFRLVQYNASGIAQSFARMGQIISEGVSLLVLNLSLKAHTWRNSVRQLLENLRPHLPSLQGELVLAVDKTSPWTSAWGCAMKESPEASIWRHLRAVTGEWPTHLRALLESKLLVVDENPLALPMFFHMERVGSQHWHRYEQSASGRSVVGAVPNMMGRLYLMELLRTLGLNETPTLPAAFGEKVGQRLGDVRICAECTKKGCCPWTPPDVLPAHSLSNVGMEFLELENLSISGCASAKADF